MKGSDPGPCFTESGHTPLNCLPPSLRCRSLTSAWLDPERPCDRRDLRRHPNLQLRLHSSEKVPDVGTLAELNARIELADAADDGRRIDGRIRTVGQDFAAEAPLLAPLPE